jgi:hypothetical protein
MLYREIIAVCSEIRTKHINTLCGQNVEFVNVKLVVHIVKVFTPTDAQVYFKRSIKIYMKTAPTYFGAITIIRERTI